MIIGIIGTFTNYTGGTKQEALILMLGVQTKTVKKILGWGLRDERWFTKQMWDEGHLLFLKHSLMSPVQTAGVYYMKQEGNRVS